MNEELIKTVEKEIREEIKKVEEDAMYNSQKVLKAFQNNKVSDMHFNMTTGYGYNDIR